MPENETPRAGPPPPVPPDPLEPRRDVLLKDPNPCVRVCGHISEGYMPDHAQLLEDVDPAAFGVWLKSASNQVVLDNALRLGLAKYDLQRRNSALGIGTRRGQQAALKASIVEYRRMVPEAHMDPTEAQIPHESMSPNGDTLTEEEMQKLLDTARFQE